MEIRRPPSHVVWKTRETNDKTGRREGQGWLEGRRRGGRDGGGDGVMEGPPSGAQVLGEQQVVVRPGEMADQLLERVERHLTEAAVERARGVLVRGAGARRYHVPVHGAQVLEQVRLLLEHGHAQPARERLLARVHAQVRLQVPAHAELLAAVRALVLAAGAAAAAGAGAGRFVRLGVRGRRGRRGRRRRRVVLFPVLLLLPVQLLQLLFRRFAGGRGRGRCDERRFHVCGQTVEND